MGPGGAYFEIRSVAYYEEGDRYLVVGTLGNVFHRGLELASWSAMAIGPVSTTQHPITKSGLSLPEL